MTVKKTNILDFDRLSLRAYIEQLNEKPYHADQIFQWVHHYGHTDFTEMTNLSKKLRGYITEHLVIELPVVEKEMISKDGTRKWLLRLADNLAIEMVFIPEKGRGTLCISSQVGCALGCKFCETGMIGFKRNLKVSEIIGQVWLAARMLSKEKGRHDHAITNVVFMGMGEPLLNLDNVIPTINILKDVLAYGFSKYRITVSTAGIIPGMQRLSEASDVALAISLHAASDALRNILMPINRTYPLKDLIAACKAYFKADPRRKISFEYIMLAGINDSVSEARKLVKLISKIACKVNLIPYNATPSHGFNPSSPEQIEAFREILSRAHINTITRKKRGDDIQAACGQLAAKNC